MLSCLQRWGNLYRGWRDSRVVKSAKLVMGKMIAEPSFLALLLMNLDLLYIILVTPTRNEEESLHNLGVAPIYRKDPSQFTLSLSKGFGVTS